MKDFQITLTLQTHLLQGGPLAGELDPAHRLRGPSVRGLLHAFARALVGPLVAADPARTREAEAALLGAARGDDGGSVTFRVQDVSDNPLKACEERFKNCVGKPEKGSSPGYSADQSRTLVFRPRPNAVRTNPRFPAALWAVVWSAFTFGSLGKRARRGYGDLVIRSARGVPAQLPLFTDPPLDEKDLARRLQRGFASARQLLIDWLRAEDNLTRQIARSKGEPVDRRRLFEPVEPAATSPSNQVDSFFQIWSMQSVRIGKRYPGDEGAMKDLIDCCHRAVGTTRQSAEAFLAAIGAPLPRDAARNTQKKVKRLASPLWFRLFKLANRRFVLVVSVSRRVAAKDNAWKAAEELLKDVGATPDDCTVAVMAARSD